MSEHINFDIDQNVQDVLKARTAILMHSKALRSVSGKIPCPICGTGTRDYSVAYNGHIRSACDTKDCVNWME